MDIIEEQNVSAGVVKHSFFLNIEQAYVEAEKKNTVIDEDGNEGPQYCYYDGPLTDILLPNFIKIEQNNFVDFFSNNKLPIPSLMIFPEGNIIDLSLDSADIIDDIKSYRLNLNASGYIHKDSYFIDRLEALNTAKQKNRVSIVNSDNGGLQLCYYNDDEITDDYENLIYVKFSNLIEFFTYSRLRVPTEVIFSADVDSETKQEVLKRFKKSISVIRSRQQKFSQELFQEDNGVNSEAPTSADPDFDKDPAAILQSLDEWRAKNGNVDNVQWQSGLKSVETAFESISSQNERFNTIEVLTAKNYKTNNVSIWLDTFALYQTHDSCYLQNLFNWVSNPDLELTTRYEIFFQIVRYLFVHGHRVSKVMRDNSRSLFRELVQEYVAMFSSQAAIRLPRQERNNDLVFILTTQFLSLKHAPTQRAMNFCESLRALGKHVYLINCASMPQKTNLDYYKQFTANFLKGYSSENMSIELNLGEIHNNPKNDGNWLHYNGEYYPFLQIENIFDSREIEIVSTILRNSQPEAVIAVGDHNPVVELIGTFLPVATYPCGAFMPSTIFSIPAVPRSLQEHDRELARTLGEHNGTIIETAYTFRIKNTDGKIKRSELGLDEDNVVFAVVGNRLDEEIGDDFLELWQMLATAIPKTKFLLIGRFSRLNYIPEALRSEVISVGQQSDVQALLRNCDFYLNPRREGGGLSSAEALANAVPVLTFRYGDVFYAVGMHFGFETEDDMVSYVQHYLDDSQFASDEQSYCMQRSRLITDNVTMVRELLDNIKAAEDKLTSYIHAANIEKNMTLNQTVSMEQPETVDESPLWKIVYESDVVFICSRYALEPAPENWQVRLSEPLRQLPDVVAVGAKRLKKEGKIFSMGEMLIHPKGFHHLGRGVTGLGYRFPEEVDVIAGGICAFNREAFDAVDGERLLEGRELGLLELCLSLRERGGRCITIPQVIVNDEHSPEPDKKESRKFKQRWKFDWRAADLSEVRRHHPQSELLWQVHFHANSMPFEKYEERPALHWDSYQTVNIYRNRADQLVNIVAANCAPESLLLDLGCGDGLFSHLMAKRNLRVLGIDPEEAAIEQARQYTGRETYPSIAPEFCTGKGELLDIANNTFDMVTMFDVIEHMPNPIVTLQEISRVLRPGGYLIVSTPAWQFGGTSDPIYHGFEYTLQELTDQIQHGINFKINNTQYIGGAYRDLIVISEKV